MKSKSYILIDDFEKYGITAGITTRIGGYSEKPFDLFNLGKDTEDNINSINKNYEKWVSDFNLNDLYLVNRIMFTHQIHSNNVTIIDESYIKNNLENNNIITTDGFITDLKKDKQLVLTVITADCQSIFLLDKKKRIISIVHSGWRGTFGKIVLNSISIMVNNYFSNINDILVFLGPCIRQDNYDVSEDFKNYFNKNIKKNNGKYYFDISGENTDICLSAGIKLKNITDIGLCTYKEKNLFYSYRRDNGKTGRMLSFITVNS